MGKYDDILDPASSGGAAVATQPAQKPSKYADIIDSEPVAQGIPTPAPTTGPAIPDTVQPQEADLWSERAMKLPTSPQASNLPPPVATPPPAGQPAAPTGPARPPLGEQLFTDLERGKAQISSMFAGLGAMATDALPGPIAKTQHKFFIDEAADFAKEAQANPRVIENIGAVKNAGDLGRYIMQAAAEQLPMMVPNLATGMGGSVIGKRLGARAVEKYVAEKVAAGVAKDVAEQQAKQLMAKYIVTYGTAASMPTATAMNTGETYLNVLEKTGQSRPGLSLAIGSVKGALDSISSVLAVKKVFRPELVTKQVEQALIKQLGKSAASQFLAEGSTETMQTLADNIAVYVADPSVKQPTDQMVMEAVDSFFTAGFAGSVIGGAAQGIGMMRQGLDPNTGKPPVVAPTLPPGGKTRDGDSPVAIETPKPAAPKPAAPAAVVADLDKNTAKWEEAGAPPGLARELAKAEVTGDQNRFNLLTDQFKRSQERKTPGKYRDIIEPSVEQSAARTDGEAIKPETAITSKGNAASIQGRVEQLRDFTGDERHDAAVQYGAEIKGKPEVIAAVRARRTELADQAAGMRARAEETTDKAESERLMNEATRVAYRSQLYNEAADAAEGVGTAATSPATAQGIKPPSSPAQPVEVAKDEEPAAQGINVAAPKPDDMTISDEPMLGDNAPDTRTELNKLKAGGMSHDDAVAKLRGEKDAARKRINDQLQVGDRVVVEKEETVLDKDGNAVMENGKLKRRNVLQVWEIESENGRRVMTDVSKWESPKPPNQSDGSKGLELDSGIPGHGRLLGGKIVRGAKSTSKAKDAIAQQFGASEPSESAPISPEAKSGKDEVAMRPIAERRSAFAQALQEHNGLAKNLLKADGTPRKGTTQKQVDYLRSNAQNLQEWKRELDEESKAAVDQHQKPVELMTPDEYREAVDSVAARIEEARAELEAIERRPAPKSTEARIKRMRDVADATEKFQSLEKSRMGGQQSYLIDAMKAQRPVNAAAVESSKLVDPVEYGYVREGDLYVFKKGATDEEKGTQGQAEALLETAKAQPASQSTATAPGEAGPISKPVAPKAEAIKAKVKAKKEKETTHARTTTISQRGPKTEVEGDTSARAVPRDGGGNAAVEAPARAPASEEGRAGQAGIPSAESGQRKAEGVAAVQVEKSGEDTTVSVPSKDKASITPKEQKKYLLAEIDRAIADAPDDKTQMSAGKVYVVKNNRASDEEAARVRIEVPGDGVFTLINTKDALTKFRATVAAKFPTKTPEASLPRRKVDNSFPSQSDLVEQMVMLPDLIDQWQAQVDNDAVKDRDADAVKSAIEEARRILDESGGKPVRDLKAYRQMKRDQADAERTDKAVAAMKKDPRYGKLLGELKERRFVVPDSGDILNVAVSGRGAPQLRTEQDDIAKGLGLSRNKDTGKFDLTRYWRDVADDFAPETMASMKDERTLVAMQAFKDWFGDSKVVGDDGKPLVVYSGHSNVELYRNFDPRRSTAGGFYASEDPAIASNYSTGKMGVREYYENGSQYRFKLKNGKWGKKLWQMELTPEQQDKARAWLKDEDNAGWDIEAYWKENAPYDAANRRALARGGLRDLQSVWQFLESMGSNIAYPEDQGIGESKPMFLRQNANTFEKLLTHLGIEWQSYDWNQPGVMPVYLRIRKPLDADKPFPADLLAALKQKAKYKRNVDEGDTHWTKDYPLKQWVADIESGDEYWTTQIPSEAIPIIKSFGYDGIKERGMKAMAEDVPREQRGINWIAFDPEQIKSAIGNRGTFDPNNADMMFSLLDETTGGGVKETTDASDTGEAGAAGAVPGDADSGEQGLRRLSEMGGRWQGWLEAERSRLRREAPDSSYQLDGAEVDPELGADPEFIALAEHNAQAGFLTVPVKDTMPWSGLISNKTIFVSRSPTLTITQVGAHERFHGIDGTAVAQGLIDAVDTESAAAKKYRDYLIGSHTASMQAAGIPRALAKLRATKYVSDWLISREIAADKYAGIARKYGVNIDEAFRDLDAANEIVGMIDRGMREQSKGDPDLFASMQERGPPVTPEQDARYLELAKDPEGNKAELQRMVDEAAKKAGYTEGPLYHGDKNEPLNEKYVRWTTPNIPIFTTYDEDGADWFGTPLPFFAKVEKQATSEDMIQAAKEAGYSPEGEYDEWPIVKEFTNNTYSGANENDLVYVPEVRRRLLEKGFDSVRVFDVLENSEIDTLIILRSPKQIKSADPITHDDKGNVIPLSARFNPERPDIRFSMKDEPPSKDYAELLQKLEEARENMRRAIGTTQAVERQAGQEKTKRAVRRKVDQIIEKQKARLAAAQEEAGVKPPKTMPSTMAGIEAARQRVGFVAGKREGHVRAVEDVVNESFKLEAKARGVRYYDWAIEAGNVLEQYLFEDSGSRLTDEQRIANARIALKNIFGVDRAAAIRRASSGDYLAAIKSVRAFMDQRIGGFYVKAIKRLASRIRRDKLFPPEMAEFDALMESAGDPKEWKKKAWHESKDIYEQARALKASSDQQQKQLAEARSEQRESNAEVLLAEALAANKVIDPLETKPIRGVIKERMVDRQAAPDVLAATAFGGTKSHGAKIMVYRPRDGEDKANALAERARTQFYDALKALGIGEAEIARERGTRQEYDFYGTPLRMSPSQRRMFYWTTLDSDGRAKMIRNGFLVSDLKGQPSKSVKGPADDMETGIDAMQVATSAKDRAAVQSAIDAIKMVAKEARLTLIMLKGIDPLRDRGGTYAPLSIERSGQQRNLEENAVAAFDAFLEKWGRFEDRVRHKNPLLIVDFYTAVEDQIDRLSKVAHMAVPIRDAMQMLGHPEVGEAVRTRMGSLFETKMRDVYRQASGFDPVFRSPPSAMSPISRRAAAARLSALLTSILKNRYLGAGAAAFRIAMDNPGMAAKFLGSAIHPVPLWTASGKADVALMMKDGYFANRWKHDLIRALTAGPGKEMAGSTEFDLMWDRELIRGLRPMARAEMSNAAAMIRAARASGMSDAQAVEYAKTVTRETQNPSSAFDESDEYRKTRANPWKSLFFPFSGQRVVSRNLVHRAIIDAHYASHGGKDAAWRKVGLAAGALLMNLAGEYLLAQLLASIRNREGGDDEKKRNKRQLMAVVSNLADLAYPMGGGLAVDAVSSYVDGDLRGASTLVGQLFESVIRGTKKAITADDMATRIKGIIEATSGGMILAGAPYVAGVSQVLGLAAGPALRTEDSKKRGYIQKSIDDLPDDPTYFRLNQALNDAFAAATDAGVVATEDEEGNPLGLAEQKARFTQSFYAQVEKKYGEEFKKGYANWRQSR